MDNNLTPRAPNKNFEEIKKIDEDRVEYWEARALMPVLEYLRWENFSKVVEKAQTACELSGQNIFDHFRKVTKMINTSKEAIRQVDDYKLSRYACYLIAQNGNSQKQAIALAQTYFATQTRKQELFENLTDDEKRLLTRGEVIDRNKKLFRTAKDSGVRNFGKFNDWGYLGLYGLTNKQIQEKKKLGEVKKRLGTTGGSKKLVRDVRQSQKEFAQGKGKVLKSFKDLM